MYLVKRFSHKIANDLANIILYTLNIFTTCTIKQRFCQIYKFQYLHLQFLIKCSAPIGVAYAEVPSPYGDHILNLNETAKLYL